MVVIWTAVISFMIKEAKCIYRLDRETEELIKKKKRKENFTQNKRFDRDLDSSKDL